MGCGKGGGTKVSWWGGAGVAACSYLPVEQAESPTSRPRHRSPFPSPDAGFCLAGGRMCWLMNRLCAWEITPKLGGGLEGEVRGRVGFSGFCVVLFQQIACCINSVGERVI